MRGETVTQEGLRSTDFLAYEAYTEMAEQMLAQIGEEIKQQWPKVEAVSIVHRTGRLEIGEPSVVIAVATPHRGDGCFEACRYAIERLKAIVPIWKQENWSDGAVWIEGPTQPELTGGIGRRSGAGVGGRGMSPARCTAIVVAEVGLRRAGVETDCRRACCQIYSRILPLTGAPVSPGGGRGLWAWRMRLAWR